MSDASGLFLALYPLLFCADAAIKQTLKRTRPLHFKECCSEERDEARILTGALERDENMKRGCGDG